MSHRKSNVPVLSGVSASRTVCPGTTSARTLKSGIEKPIKMSCPVSSNTTGTPRLSVILSGVNVNLRACTRMTVGPSP